MCQNEEGLLEAQRGKLRRSLNVCCALRFLANAFDLQAKIAEFPLLTQQREALLRRTEWYYQVGTGYNINVRRLSASSLQKL